MFKKQTHIQLEKCLFLYTFVFDFFFISYDSKHLLSSKTFHTPCLFLDCMFLWE